MKLVYRYLYFAQPRLKFLKTATGSRYLDFGCGTGLALAQNLLVRSDLECYCVDVQDFSKDLPENAIFTIYNGKKLPYEDNSFDIITANHVLEHLPKPDFTIDEICRVLRANGSVFFETPNERSLWGEPGGKFSGTVHFHDDPTHIRPYSRNELQEVFERHGLETIKTGITRNLLHLFLSPALLLAGFVFPKSMYYMHARNSLIGWSSYIILEKLL
jgi:SAM-dependent methyltransferase